jgi:signal transduction histidine kinase
MLTLVMALFLPAHNASNDIDVEGGCVSATHISDSTAWERAYAAQAAVQAHHESSSGAADFLGRLGATIAGLVGARYVVFSLLDQAGHELIPQAEAHGLTAEELASLGTLPVDPGADDAVSRVVFRNQVLRIDPRGETPPAAAAEALPRLGAGDAVSVCWRAAERPVGMLTAAGSVAGGFTDDDVRVLRTAAQAAGMVWRHKQTETDLARLYAEAREANRVMDGFVSMVAHELRGPLTVVSGYASMIARGDLGEPPEAWQRPLGYLVEHSGRMRRLVDDLLLAARLSSGRQAPAPQRVDLRDAVSAALERATPGAELTGARLDAALPDEPVEVVADPEHLAVILDNLLSNALAYGGSPARVEVTVTDDGSVLVADNGRGVPEDMRERIFERFVRIDEGRGAPAGTGLGLYIGRELATQLGGSLTIDARAADRGTTFALQLPLTREGRRRRAAAGGRTAVPAAPRPASGSRDAPAGGGAAAARRGRAAGS